MIDIKRLREWCGLNQYQFAANCSIDQGGLSKIEAGTSSATSKLKERIIDAVTPTVLFIRHSEKTPDIVNAMLVVGQIDCVEHDPDLFNAALKNGKRIAVVTDNKQPFLELIEQALAESGLPYIPMQGIKFNGNGQAEMWDELDL